MKGKLERVKNVGNARKARSFAFLALALDASKESINMVARALSMLRNPVASTNLPLSIGTGLNCAHECLRPVLIGL